VQAQTNTTKRKSNGLRKLRIQGTQRYCTYVLGNEVINMKKTAYIDNIKNNVKGVLPTVLRLRIGLSAREMVVIVKFFMFSRSTRVRKDGVVIELMGRLDELEALASWAYIETSL